MILTESDERRFWSKVALPNEQGCMLWLAHANRGGYGVFSIKGRLYKAHRVSYTLAYGPIPEGLQIDHVKARGCLNRHCVAPEHLEAVTRAENIRRADPAAANRAKTHCPQGHPYAGENLYVNLSGGRVCRTCTRDSQRAGYRRARAA